jgi:hypothetical protein
MHPAVSPGPLRRAGSILVLAALPSLLAAGLAPAALVLNEFQADNRTTLPDEMGDFDDWIEVLNTGPAAVDLTGMFLTDDLAATTRWPIPSLALDPGERALFWADQEPAEGPFHTTFQLGQAGEALGLFNTLINGNAPIDTLRFGEQAPDAAYGRFPDGTGSWIYLATPTPNLPNVDQGNIAPLVSGTDHEPNSPAENQSVTITSRMRDLDGSLIDTRLFYNPGSGFIAVTMFDDGQHGDGAAGDQVHGIQVPGFPGNTTVRYYVRARDNDLAQVLDPPGAPGITYSYVVAYVPPPLYVNEFMASNTVTIADEFGEFDDWVEIYNGGPSPVNLSGLNLSDNLAIPNKYTFPNVILGPHDFLLVWCDGTPGQGVFHANYQLSATNGEQLGLFASAANGYAVIDSLSFGPQTTDVSYGREPDGGPVWRFYSRPSPRLSNTLPIAVGEEPAPAAPGVRLEAPAPNPFLPGRTAVRLSLPRAGAVSLALYDVRGRRLAVVAGGVLAAGTHTVDLEQAVAGERGAPGGPARGLPSGTYFLRLSALGETRIQKLQVLR